MELDGVTFRATANSAHGTLNTATQMTFAEADGTLTAVYGGGTIRHGTVVASHQDDGTVDMLYHCITTAGELKAGQAHATFVEADGATRMHLDWQWLTGDRERGQSEWVRGGSVAS
jgi:hypothetical protein